jgi:hypothetical protein
MGLWANGAQDARHCDSSWQLNRRREHSLESIAIELRMTAAFRKRGKNLIVIL